MNLLFLFKIMSNLHIEETKTENMKFEEHEIEFQSNNHHNQSMPKSLLSEARSIHNNLSEKSLDRQKELIIINQRRRKSQSALSTLKFSNDKSKVEKDNKSPNLIKKIIEKRKIELKPESLGLSRTINYKKSEKSNQLII